MTFHRYILNKICDNLQRSVKPPLTTTATHAVIYREPTSEPKYFDIETPLYLVEGKWQRWNPFVAMVDFWDKQAKEATDTLDMELRDGMFVIK